MLDVVRGEYSTDVVPGEYSSTFGVWFLPRMSRRKAGYVRVPTVAFFFLTCASSLWLLLFRSTAGAAGARAGPSPGAGEVLRGGAAVVLGRRGRGLRGGFVVENFAAVSRLAAGVYNGCERTNDCLFGQQGLGVCVEGTHGLRRPRIPLFGPRYFCFMTPPTTDA